MNDHLQKFSSKIKNNKEITFSGKRPDKSSFVGKIRYWWSWIVLGIIILFIALPLLIFYRFRKKRDGFFSWCDWGVRIWLWTCGVKVNVRGKENLEEDRQYVFISNHLSYLDTAALYVFTGRRIGLVAKKELLQVPIFGYGMSIANVIAIDRENLEKAKKSIEKACSIIDEGYSFGVFAEGTRAMPGKLLPFKKGAIHLALQTRTPIIPIAFKNSDQLMGKRIGALYPGTIEMILLPAVETEGKTKDDVMELLVKTRGAVANELAN